MPSSPRPSPSAEIAGEPPRVLGAPALGTVGLIGGTIGALLGGGTGTITVPALDRFSDMPRGTIHGTAAIPNTAVALVGAAFYALHGGALDARAGIPLMIGGVIGVNGGARFVARASERTLRRAFVVVLILAGVTLLVNALSGGPSAGNAVLPAAIRDHTWATAGPAIVLGAIVGAWSSAMGLGGGMLTVPILTLLFGTGAHTAEGTSLAVMLPNSLFGAIAHVRQHTASPPVGLRLSCGAAPGAVLGATIGLALSGKTLGIVFGCFLLFMASRELARMRPRARAPA